MKNLKIIFISFWFLTALGGVIYLHRVHSIPVAETSIHPEKMDGDINISHFLSPECKCSHLLRDHFIKRGPSSYNEKFYIIKTHDESLNRKITQPLEKAGFKTELISEEKVTGVPLLVIQNTKGESLYTGGYTQGAIRPDSIILDIQIANDLKHKKNITAYSALGCAVSEKLKKYIDPLGVKSL